MSWAVKKSAHFLNLLLDVLTPLNQKHALIFTSSDLQANALAEILLNLSAGLIRLPKQAELVIKKNQPLIKSVNKLKSSKRGSLIRNKYKRVCSIIVAAKKIIIELLAECKSR